MGGASSSEKLIRAAKRNDEVGIAAILSEKKQVDMDFQDPFDGHTALLAASRNGNINIVKLLMNAKANPLVKGINDKTAVDWAKEGNKRQVVAFIEQSLGHNNIFFTQGAWFVHADEHRKKNAFKSKGMEALEAASNPAMRQRYLEDSVVAFDAAIQANRRSGLNDDADCHFLKACALRELGHFQACVESCDSALAINSSEGYAEGALEQIHDNVQHVRAVAVSKRFAQRTEEAVIHEVIAENLMRAEAMQGTVIRANVSRSTGSSGDSGTAVQTLVAKAAALAAKPEPDSIEDLPDDALCSICLQKPKAVAFVPCGHRCVCKDCPLAMLQQSEQEQEVCCPICRVPPNDFIAVFDT